jgi:nucleoside-diphosphate-sugar epimerase
MKVLLTGASGFVGRELRVALEALGHQVTSVGRTGPAASASHVVADLREDDLSGPVAGQDFVVHAASTTKGEAEMLWRGNVDATRRVVNAAARRDLPMIYISTTGVYGCSYGHFGDPSGIPRRPTSTLSAARAAAEDLVLANGGTVIRPHVTHGLGDRWVVPPLTRFMLREAAWLGSPSVEVAAISARRLAAGTAALLRRSTLPPVLHAAEPDPVAVADLVRPSFLERGQTLPTRALTVDEAFYRLRKTGVSRNALYMLGRPSSMDSSDFWWRDTSARVTTSTSRRASAASR